MYVAHTDNKPKLEKHKQLLGVKLINKGQSYNGISCSNENEIQKSTKIRKYYTFKEASLYISQINLCFD